MPNLSDYASLVPFGKIDELVDAANSILRLRPRLQVSPRTVRYYASPDIGILPRHSGSPKFPRYGLEHLARLVAARLLLDSGETLQSAREQIEGVFAGSPELGIKAVENLIEPREPSAAPFAAVRASPLPASSRDQGIDIRGMRPVSKHVWKLQLAPGITLEFDDRHDLEEAVRIAKKSLEDFIDSP